MKINIFSTHLLLSLSPKMLMVMLSPPDVGKCEKKKDEWKQAAVLTDHSYDILILQNFTKTWPYEHIDPAPPTVLESKWGVLKLNLHWLHPQPASGSSFTSSGNIRFSRSWISSRATAATRQANHRSRFEVTLAPTCLEHLPRAILGFTLFLTSGLFHFQLFHHPQWIPFIKLSVLFKTISVLLL